MPAAAERLQGAAALQPVQAVQHGAVIADAGGAGGQHRAVAGDEVGALAVQMQAGEQGGHVDLRVGEKAVGLLVEADDHAGGVPPRHGADIIGDAVLLHTLGVDLGGVDETLQPGGGRAVQPGHARVLTGVAGGLQLQVRVEEGNAAEPYLVHEVLQIGVGGQGGVQLQMAAERLYAVGQTEQALGAVRRFQLMEADALQAQSVQRVVRQGLSAAEAVPAGQVQGQEEQQDAGEDAVIHIGHIPGDAIGESHLAAGVDAAHSAGQFDGFGKAQRAIRGKGAVGHAVDQAQFIGLPDGALLFCAVPLPFVHIGELAGLVGPAGGEAAHIACHLARHLDAAGKPNHPAGIDLVFGYKAQTEEIKVSIFRQ